MATQLDLIKVISTLVPQYEGESEKLSCVLDALRAVNTLITDATRQMSIQVILARFSGKARNAIGQNPQTVQEIIDALEQRCKSTETPEMIIAKLNSMKQQGEISKFTECVEKLTTQLENAYISDNIPAQTAAKMAVSAGVKSLTNGIKTQDSKILLKAGQFSTISSAIQKVLENEPSASQPTQMFVANKAKPNDKNNSYNRSNNFSRSNNNGFQARGRYNNGRYPSNNYWQARGNSFRPPNNYNQRGRGGYPPRGRNIHVYYQQQQPPVGATQQNAPPIPAPQIQGHNNVQHFLGQPFGERTQ
nr:uncharacterized protein LOC115267842 [Aedes albopictus]